MRRASPIVKFRPSLEALEDRRVPALFLVNSNLDTPDANLNDLVAADSLGRTTLRSVIQQTNFNGGSHEVNFANVNTITLTSGLPPIRVPLNINGRNPAGQRVEISGTVSGGSTIFGGILAFEFGFSGGTGGTGSSVRGLVINGSLSTAILLGNGGGNTVQDCFLGTDVTGTVARPNQSGIISASPNNLIGGDQPGQGNLISGNGRTTITIGASGAIGGVMFFGGLNDNCRVEGNLIGVDVTGVVPLGNTGVGVTIIDGQTTGPISENVLIGSTTPGSRNIIAASNSSAAIGLGSANIAIGRSIGTVIQNNYIGTDATGMVSLSPNTDVGVDFMAINGVIRNNLISGHTKTDADGLRLTNANGTFVQGNKVGTNASGNAQLRNARDGVAVIQGQNILVGGTGAGLGNLISGNGRRGVYVANSAAQGNVAVRGNYIGTNASGDAAIGNVADGVHVNNFFDFTFADTVTDNVIAANGGNGVTLMGQRTDVKGNKIGVNATATAKLGNALDGIAMLGPIQNSVIGGTTATEANVIGGNGGAGITASNSFNNSNNNALIGNYIGTNPAGTDLGNTGDGVRYATFGTRALPVGGTASGAGNVIAFNGGNGVTVVAGFKNIPILGNSIYSNGRLGIDLGDNGVTVNDTNDADSGANDLQNYPVISSVTVANGQTTITGSFQVNTFSNPPLRLEFFSSPTADPSGFGEGRVFLGATSVVANVNPLSFSVTLPVAVVGGHVISATATDLRPQFGDPNLPVNNTSEFSPAFVVPNLPPTAGSDAYSVPANMPTTINAPGVLGNDSDPDGGQLSAVLVGNPAHGVMDLRPDGSFTYTPTPGYSGGDSFTYRASDGSLLSGIAVVQLTVQGGGQPLVITGTSGDDVIIVRPGRNPGQIVVDFNGVVLGPYTSVSRVQAFGLEGNDRIEMAATLGLPGELDGGPGNDMLVGGAGADVLRGGNGRDSLSSPSGDDILLGGDDADVLRSGAGNSVLAGGNGNDALYAGMGRNILIGGLGADTVVGGAGDDLLIAGRLLFEDNQLGLAAIRAEWASGRSYASRLANLMGTGSGGDFENRLNGNFFLTVSGTQATVLDDGMWDVLLGAWGRDAYFANREGGVLDEIVSLATDELVIELLRE